MIALGTWEAQIDTLFFKGSGVLKVFDDGGKYGFKVLKPDIETPDIKIISCEEDDCDLRAVVQCDMLPGRDIELDLFIDEDILSGSIKIPRFGKIKLKNGRRIGV